VTKHIITNPEAFPIQPDQIDTSDHLWDAFDHHETEISARWIVQFCQQRGQSWSPIRPEELTRYYRTERKQPHERFCFNRLIDPGTAFYGGLGSRPVGGGWLMKQDDGTLAITDEFVTRCHQASPSTPP
jgi:hypothetical protein